MISKRLVSTCVALIALASAANGAGRIQRFQLRLPDLQVGAISGDRVDAPAATVRRIEIDVLSPLSEQLRKNLIHTSLNGLATATISEVRRNGDALTVILHLDRREEFRLQPGENTVSISVQNQRGREFDRTWQINLGERDDFVYEFTGGPGVVNPGYPDVNLLRPQEPLKVDRSRAETTVSVVAKIRSRNPIRSVRLGELALTDLKGKTQGDLETEIQVGELPALVPLAVVDTRGNASRIWIPVSYAPRRAPPRLSGRMRLLSIAIARYPEGGEDMPFHRASEVNSAAIAAGLDELGLLGEEDLTALEDGLASSTAVKSSFGRLVRALGPSEVLIVYFAGYGIREPGFPLDRTYLATSDTRPGQLRATAVDLEDLAYMLDEGLHPEARVILVLDVFEPLNAIGGAAGRRQLIGRLADLGAGSENIVVLAPDPGYADEGLAMTFLDRLTEGTLGAADLNQDRVLTSTEVFDFLRDQSLD